MIGLAVAIAALALVDAGADPGAALVLRPDRRGADLRPAHRGVRPRPADAGRVLHARADRRAGQPAQHRRHRRPARADQHAVLGGRPTWSAWSWCSAPCSCCRGRSRWSRWCCCRSSSCPAKWVGRRMSALTREQMQLDAEMSSVMTERFNVAGAMVAKLYGRPEDDARDVRRPGRPGPRRRASPSACTARVFRVALGLVAALATALVYGIGGVLAVDGAFELGTLVALAALLMRLYGPLTALSNVHVDVMTALVSFDRVFEVLDLEPMVDEKPDARPLPDGPGHDRVRRRPLPLPGGRGGVAGLAGVGRQARTRRPVAAGAATACRSRAAPGALIALVGHSGAGKTTITALVSRLYDVNEGAVRINGLDVRDATLASLRDTVGVVMQDAHLFHDTIGANLRYARPEATEEEIWDGAAGRADRRPGRGAARRARHRRRRPRLPAVRRREAAAGAGPAAAQGAARGRARRGHRAPGLGVRGGGAAGAEDRAGGPHLAGDRAPAVDDPGGRPDPGRRTTAASPSGAGTRSCWRAAACTPSSTAPSSARQIAQPGELLLGHLLHQLQVLAAQPGPP